MKKISNLIFVFIFSLFVFSFALRTLAQSNGGSADGTTPPVDPTTTGGTTPPPSTGLSTQPANTLTTPASTPTPVKPKTTTTKPVVKPVLAIPTPEVNNQNTTPATSSNNITFIVTGILAIGLGTTIFTALKIKKSQKKDDGKCLNFKKLMEEKLNDVTDLKSQLEDLAKEKGREAAKNMTEGTSAGELLNLIENGQKEYERLKELYEKCITEFNSTKYYRGVIIEESLVNKEVLGKVKTIETKIEQVGEKHKTPWLKQWTLHNVEIKEEDADKVAREISQNLDKEKGWYADFKNKNYHFIIYREKIFKVDLKNPVLYKDAKQYGISLGIPEYQVDFAPLDKIWER